MDMLTSFPLLLPLDIDARHILWDNSKRNYAHVLCSRSNSTFDVTIIAHAIWFNIFSPIFSIHVLNYVLLHSLLSRYFFCSFPFNIIMWKCWNNLCADSIAIITLHVVRCQNLPQRLFFFAKHMHSWAQIYFLQLQWSTTHEHTHAKHFS